MNGTALVFVAIAIGCLTIAWWLDYRFAKDYYEIIDE
jgi:hypothetical protein